MITTEGKEISAFQAAKEIFYLFGTSWQSKDKETLAKAIKVVKITDKQSEKLYAFLNKVSARVCKSLNVRG